MASSATGYLPSIDPLQLTPDTRAKVAEWLKRCAAAGYGVQIVSGRRTCAEQNAIYAQGRTTPGAIVTHAKGCFSWHVLGRAIDFRFVDRKATRDDYAAVAHIAKELGFKWGGEFKSFIDLPHLEYHPGMTIEEMCPDTDDCDAATARSFEAGMAALPPEEDPPSSAESSRGMMWFGAALVLGALGAGYAYGRYNPKE